MFLVHRYNIKNTGQESHSTQKYDDEISAQKRYYSILASDIDNSSIVYELVQVIRMKDGIVTMSQVFDNRQPEPEPIEE